MKIIITAKEIMEKGCWSDVCKLKGYNEWSMAEGQIWPGTEIELTLDQARQLGLLEDE